MKLIILLFLSVSCATAPRPFTTEAVCSDAALAYLASPVNKSKHTAYNPRLIDDLKGTQRDMQLCYEDFRGRTGSDVFNTCLVVGINGLGEKDFHEFSSKEVELDGAFVRCAMAVTGKIPYATYGRNYVLIQSYQFYSR